MDDEYLKFARELEKAAALASDTLAGHKGGKPLVALLENLKDEFQRLMQTHWTMQMTFAERAAIVTTPPPQS